MFRSITAKIVILASLAALAAALGGTFAMGRALRSYELSSLQAEEKSLREGFDRLIKSEVETAVSLLSQVAKQRDAGRIDKAAAATLAAALPAAPESPASDIPPPGMREIHHAVDQLEQLLACSDADALAVLDRHAAALRAALGPAHTELARQVRQFDFDAALRTLRKDRPTWH